MSDKGLVLIADNDSLLCRTIAGGLRRRGYRTITSKPGEEALELAKRRTPDVMIVDCVMQGMDGLAAIRELAENAHVDDIPLILLSARTNNDLEKMANIESCRWSARLEKPITMQALVDTIERVKGRTTASETRQEACNRVYLEETLARLESTRMDLEPDKPQSVRDRALELAVRHAGRLADGAEEMKMSKLARLAGMARSALVGSQEDRRIENDDRHMLFRLVQEMAADIRGRGAADPRAEDTRKVGGKDPVGVKVPWVLFLCDDADFAAGAAARGRFYGVCINSVSNPDLAIDIAGRHPFAGAILAGGLANRALEIIPRLRDKLGAAPIVVAGAASADAHKKILQAGANRTLPAHVEAERVVATLGGMIHDGIPALGTALAIAEDPATLAAIESRLMDLGMNVVSVPSITALDETVEVIEPDVLIAEPIDDTQATLAALEALRSRPRWSGLATVVVADSASEAHEMLGRKRAADEVVLKETLADQIKGSVLGLLRTDWADQPVDVDPITGAMEPEAFRLMADSALARANASRESVALAIVSIDGPAMEAKLGRVAADLMRKALFQRLADATDAIAPTLGKLDRNRFGVLASELGAADLKTTVLDILSAFSTSVPMQVAAVEHSGEIDFAQLEARALAEADAARSASTGEDTAMPPVYIVEDDQILRRVLSEHLERAGFECVEFADGKTAVTELLASASHTRPPVVLLDLDLPELDGWGVLARLRAERPGSFHTVIMTSEVDDELELKSLRAGATDFLAKPLRVPVIVERVRRLSA